MARLHQRLDNISENTFDFPAYAMADLINFLLEPLSPKNGKDWLLNHSLINKYLIGNHFILTNTYIDDHEKARDLFLLRRNYKESYQASPVDLQIKPNPEVLDTFSNITFGQSLEGGVTLVEVSKEYDHPFFEGFIDKARNSYFIPFILALHQRFTLIYFATHMAQLDITDKGAVRGLRERILDFILKWRFSQVSNVTMYNKFYENWRNVLGLETLLNEIREEINELDEDLERKAREDEEAHYKAAKQDRKEEEQRHKALEKVFTWVNVLIIPVLLVTGIFGMNVSEFTGSGYSLLSIQFMKWFMPILALYFIPYLILHYRLRKSIRKDRKR